MENLNNIFMDKIRLSMLVLNKEASLVEVYADMIKQIRMDYLKKEEIEQSQGYNGAWTLCYELYLFLQFNKIAEIESNKKFTNSKETIGKLRESMENYGNLKKNLGIAELKLCFDVLRNIISISGYHDDKFKQHSDSFDDEES